MTTAPRRPPVPDTAPLPRSLDPLPGESLKGFLLRLSYRLHVAPLELARLVGCTSGRKTKRIGYQFLFDLDVARLAQVTRLTAAEAESLTAVSWASRYPPISRSLARPRWPVNRDAWLVRPGQRYCPDCLAGDDSPAQQQYGGPWKKHWLLPISFACPVHQRFLREECPREHLHLSETSARDLIETAGESTLHPAQCRRRAVRGSPTRERGIACGARMDEAGPEGKLVNPGQRVLNAQRRLLGILDGPQPADEAARAFTDIRLITVLLHASWPLGQDLMDHRLAAAADEDIRRIKNLEGAAAYQALDQPPGEVLAAAGLLTAAVEIRDSPDLPDIMARHKQATRLTRHASPWARVLDRYRCSPPLRTIGERLTGPSKLFPRPRGKKAPARAGGYRPEHIPALLDERWYLEHFGDSGTWLSATIRRTGAILLVRRASGGSLFDAARFLGIPFSGRAPNWPPLRLRPYLREHGPDALAAALDALADRLDATPGLIDYRRRRHALREWCLDQDAWQEIVSRLPPHTRGKPVDTGDCKRQEASVYVWCRVTQGEARNAPRPIAAAQPEGVRRAWVVQRSTTWVGFTRPGSSQHYTGLRKLLIEHADGIASDIDSEAVS